MKPVAWVEISKENLLHNISQIKSILGPHKLGVVVKANAYGHGLDEVVLSIENDIDYFQVDDFQELQGIRKRTQKPVLVLGYMTLEESLCAVENFHAILGIFKNDQKRFEALNDLGKKLARKVIVHIEIDAFLGRLGILAADVEKLIKDIKKYEYIEIQAMYAHFSDIEDKGNLDHAHRQYQQLKDLADFVGIPYHISATSGILSDPENNWGGFMMRLGIGLYGIWPSESLHDNWKEKIILKAVLSWKTQIAQVKNLPAGYPVGYGQSFITQKETKIAVIPQGYSDGYDRRFSNNGVVLIQGSYCSIIGRVAMNMFVVDVSHLEIVSEGDEVVLIGNQGNHMISASDLAQKVGTINYEILTRISPLLPRKIV
jgi:alanine racemase